MTTFITYACYNVVKVGRWAPLIYELDNRQYDVLTSPTSAATLTSKQQTGIWKFPRRDKEHQCNDNKKEDICIQELKESSLAGKCFKNTSHIEMMKDVCTILNGDWFLNPKLRYCVSALLAGAILVEKYKVPS
ncbi:hypothetical protein BDF21DRAFT_405039 [Thamnidium elegans]|nr:hypothetical protein BDF21DRAFT_405039 [Thamnidium elegans]